MASRIENEQTRVVGDFVCEAIQDSSASGAKSPGRGRNDAIRLVGDFSVNLAHLECKRFYGLAGEAATSSSPSSEESNGIPRIEWDRGSEWLTILYSIDLVPSRVVQVKVKRRIDELTSEELVSRDIQLREATNGDGARYLYAEIYMPLLLGERINEIKPGTELIYTVDRSSNQ